MRRSVDLIVVSILLVCSVLLLHLPMAGQAGEANLVGVVSDSTGAVVVGATITALSSTTGLNRTVQSGKDGAFSINSLPPGPYKVSVSQTGFGTQEAQIVLLTGTSPNVNFTLAPAGSKLNVTVEGLAPEIETNTATLHTTVTPQQVDTLPINGRDFSTLAALVPGVTAGNTSTGANFDPTKSNVPAISINGQNGRNLYMTIDGTDNTDIFMGGQNITLSLEAVQEFEVLTHDPKAEFGRGIGGVVNVVTKSGSNNFHGSAFGFFRTDTLQAIDPILKANGKPKAPFSSQQMGGTIGGPLIKDRLFFFYSYERDQDNTSHVFNSAGAFPSLDGTASQQPFRQNLNLVRLDYHASDKNTVFLRYAQENNERDKEFFGSGNPAPGSTANEINKFQDVTLGVTSVFGSTKVNDLRLHYQYWNDDIKNTTSSLNAPTIILPSATFGPSQLGTQNPAELTDQFADNFSWNRGKHNLRFGVNFVYQPHEGISGDFRHNRYAFTTNDYDPATNMILPGNSLANFRTWSSPDFNIVNRPLLHSGAYVQDDIRLHRLSVSLGLHYDYVHNLFYDRGTLAENLVAQFHNVVPGGPGRARPRDTPDEFAPRVAFAYDVKGDGRTVVRAGFARIYDEAAIPSGSLFADLEVTQANGAPPFNFVFVPGNIAKFFNVPCSTGFNPPPCQPKAFTGTFPFSFPIGWVTSPDMKVAKSDQGNVGISHQLGGNGPLAGLVLEAQGVYNYTSRLEQGRNLNYCINNNPTCLSGSFTPTGVNFPQAGPYDPLTNLPRQIFLADSTGRADYRALILSARRNFGKRWQLLSSYTLSRAQTDTNEFQFLVLGQANPHAPGEFGPSNWDETHRVVIAGSVDLGKGFMYSTIFTGASARPYTAALFNNDANNDGVPTVFGAVNNGPSGSRTESVANGDRVGQRGAHRGSPTISWDMRILKGISIRKLSETARLEGLFEVFNLTNHANYGQNYFDAIDQPGSFGKPIAIITAPRTAQLGARFVF